MTVGVAISTHKRPKVLLQALQNWAVNMPDVLVVNNDTKGLGIAVTKNRGIAALMDAGCDHLFLCDDDVWPVSHHWAKPYVTDQEPHLMHCWGKSRLIGVEGHYTLWRWPRGVMLYVERHVIEAIGGMRVEFGRWGGEHVEWTRRIHNAGFTTYNYADLVVCRDGVWHAEDYTRRIQSTVSQQERDDSTALRHELYEIYRGSTDFVEYRSD